MGCIPVLIADMPAWPFDRRLAYRSFSYEFDWSSASKEPRRVVEYLLSRPAAEIDAKRAQLLRVRERFFYHAEPRAGATQELIKDMCSKPAGRPFGGKAGRDLEPVYRARPKVVV